MTAPTSASTKRPVSKILIAATTAGLAILVLSGMRAAMRADASASLPGDGTCGPAFFRRGARCCPTSEPMTKLGDGLCFVVASPASPNAAASLPPDLPRAAGLDAVRV
jgi:hypothetical protein